MSKDCLIRYFIFSCIRTHSPTRQDRQRRVDRRNFLSTSGPLKQKKERKQYEKKNPVKLLMLP